MIVLSWSLNGRCSWKRSIYIQKKNSEILFACMYSWFFSMSELGFFLAINCTCGTLVKNMIYRRQWTQKSPRHNIGKKIYQLLPKKLLKIFFRLDLIMDYYNIQVYNGTSLSLYYPGNFIWWEINSQSQLLWTRNHFLTVILSNWNPSCINLLFISSDKIVWTVQTLTPTSADVSEIVPRWSAFIKILMAIIWSSFCWWLQYFIPSWMVFHQRQSVPSLLLHGEIIVPNLSGQSTHTCR